jgi:hypothetical protein
MSALAAPDRVATELRRWRDSRRFSQLELACARNALLLAAGLRAGVSRVAPRRRRRLDELLGELESHVPPMAPGRDHVGFAVPLRLRCDEGELRLITTLTSFATAVDVTLAELHLEAFLPADNAPARILHKTRPAGRRKRRGRPPTRACRRPARLTAVYRTARKTLSRWSPSTGIDSLIDTTDRVGRRWT